MAEINNATCCICGRKYHKCLSCKDSMKLQPWKSITDTSECYKVFQAVKGFSTGLYNKNEFKSKLKNIDLSNLENYRDHIKVLIKDALKESKPVKKEPIAETAAEEESVVEAVVEEEAQAVEKADVSRKRNYKANNDVEETE